jgi:DNA-binding CsgD family transcriptional regulator
MKNPWNLSEREAEVLSLVADLGCSKLAATAASISPKTVDIHMARSMAKMKARNRLQAVLMLDRWNRRMTLPELDEEQRNVANQALVLKLHLIETRAA